MTISTSDEITIIAHPGLGVGFVPPDGDVVGEPEPEVGDVPGDGVVPDGGGCVTGWEGGDQGLVCDRGAVGCIWVGMPVPAALDAFVKPEAPVGAPGIEGPPACTVGTPPICGVPCTTGTFPAGGCTLAARPSNGSPSKSARRRSSSSSLVSG